MKKLLAVVIFCLPAFGQAIYSGPGSYSGAGQWNLISGGGGIGAGLPINWVDSGDICSTSSYDNTVYVDGGSGTGHYAETPAGLVGALQAWASAPDQWWHIIVPAGALLHGSTYDSNNSLVTLPAKTGATKCAVVESSSPPTANQILCSHGLPGYGGTRNPGCTNDIASLWTLRMDSAPISGYRAIYACGGNNMTYGNTSCFSGGSPNPANHILLRDMEVTVAPGAYQSGKGVNAAQLIKFDSGPQYLGIEYSYLHGWDPGDSGQPAGACSETSTYPTIPYGDGGWLLTGGVTATGATVTQAAGDHFGMTFSDGTHSSGYPQAVAGQSNQLLINGVGYTITNHDPAATDSVLTVSPAPPTLPSPATITATSITSDVLTVTATNSFSAGNLVYLSGTAESYLNGQTVAVLSTGLSSTQFEATFTAANETNSSEKSGATVSIAFSLLNPTTKYANGCGDDVDEGVGFGATESWFQWNYIEKIHWWASESHAFSFGFSNGPDKIAHNWMEGGSNTLFSGGAAVDTKGGPANDVEIRGNFLGRDLGYRFLTGSAGNSPAPPFGCGPMETPASNNTCPMSWAIKNSLELKLGNRVLVDGNIICCSWADAQSGFVIVSNPRSTSGGTDGGIYNQSTGQPLTVIANVTLTDNWISNSPQGMELGTRSLGPGDGGGLSQPEDYLAISNNVWSNVGDTNQWNSPGGELIDWGGYGANDFSCAMSRDASGVATASCSPILLANGGTGGAGNPPVPVCGAGCGLMNNAISVSSVNNSGGVVTVKFGGSRQDPYVGQNVTVYAPSAYAGTFAVTGVYNNGVNTLCSSPDNSQPQPCVRSDGTFGDSLTYSDSSAPAGSLCSSASACNTAGVAIVIPTLAFKMLDMSPGDAVYTPYCWNTSTNSEDTSYEVGATSIVQAASSASPTSLVISFPNAGSVDSSGNTICELENDSGHPYGSIFANNTVLTPTGEAIVSGGTYRQHYNNYLTHNVFAAPAGTGSFAITCSHITGEGNVALSQCWDTGSLNEYDNLIVNQSSNPPTVLCSGSSCWNEVWPSGSTPADLSPNADCSAGPVSSCMGWTGFTVTGGNGLTFPGGACTYDGSNPLNCPLMGAPWSSNFALSDLVPLSGSSYTTEGVNVPSMVTAFTQTEYVCPSGGNCGIHGPYPDN
ncbi:MAG: hypothetical protein WBP73_05305 [Terriglobales bacterium]